MFTIEQIKEAHSRVASGSDFPNYIQDLVNLGVLGYETFTNDGHVAYFGNSDFKAVADKSYDNIPVAPTANKERFIEYLVMHQEGQTDYLTFCHHAAQCGIAKWSVNIIEMTCTYFDAKNDAILIEKIPS